MLQAKRYILRLVTSLTRAQKSLILLSIDVALVTLSLYLTLIIGGYELATLQAEYPIDFVWLTSSMSVAASVLSILIGLPRIKLNAYEQDGIQRTAAFAVLVGFVGAVVLNFLFEGQAEIQVMVVFSLVLTVLAVSARILLHKILIVLYREGKPRQRVLIYGAGQTGVQLATALRTDDTIAPVAFVDDNHTLRNIMVAGLPVFPPVRIKTLISDRHIDRIVLAMPSISRPKQVRLARQLATLGCEVSMVPSFAAIVGKSELVDRIQNVIPSDYLGRNGLSSDLVGLCDPYIHRTIMITGAGGSIGSELTRQLVACRPSKIVLFEISEFSLYQLHQELHDLVGKQHGIEILPILGSVTDGRVVDDVIARHKVEVILHAAAYKHVPLVEDNQLVGLQNNVIGTRIIAEAAAKAEQVTHFILVSTDKAVNPTNVMGASKRLAELLVQDLATRTLGTKFGIVRFGNVLGSSGSVLPLFQEQIARGGPVTVTHREVSRYFMTMSEAASLVLMAGAYAGSTPRRGDLFLLDMGKPVSIFRVAQQMIDAAGYTIRDSSNPDGDIEIKVTGLKPGEKLHEELTMQGSVQQPTLHPKIFRAVEVGLSEIEVAAALRGLLAAIETNDEVAALKSIERWVGFRKSSDPGGCPTGQTNEPDVSAYEFK